MARKKETAKETPKPSTGAKWYRVKTDDVMVVLSTRTVFADEDGYVFVNEAEFEELKRMLNKG